MSEFGCIFVVKAFDSRSRKTWKAEFNRDIQVCIVGKLLDKRIMVSQISFILRGRGTKQHQSYGARGPELKCMPEDAHHPRVETKGADSGEKPRRGMAPRKDLDAARSLVQLSNDVWNLPNNDMHSDGMNGMPPFKVHIIKLDNYSGVSKGKTKKHFGKFQKSAVKDTMKAERKQKEGEAGNDLSVPQLKYLNGYVDKKDNLIETYGFLDGNGLTIKLGSKERQYVEASLTGGQSRLGMLLSGCNWMTKERKRKTDTTYVEKTDESDHLHRRSQKLNHEPPTLKKLKLQKVNAKPCSVVEVKSDPPLSRRTAMDDVVPKAAAEKQQQCSLITPTIHTGFSFSIIHLLSAVRMAMITSSAEDALAFGKHFGEDNPECGNEFCSNGIEGKVNNSEQTEKKNLLSITIDEIVQRVRSNPGDPAILETREPLKDLVRGVLKIFSSERAPLGARGWKALTRYEKSSRSWSWIGSVSFNSSNPNSVGEEISSEAWGLPHTLLVKLVDSFAYWLENAQEILQQIGGLPAPPATLMQPTVNVEERFRYLGQQKNVATISPSSEDVRDYFHREEVLRYSVPDRAFAYTAAGGRKSTVAPLKRCSGKPSAKSRDHVTLKSDRPASVNLLCLVRDAAARLPGGIGTRADVCILLRDSQSLGEDISDSKIHKVVSGALDRLHYEADPCVKFDGDKKLWVYLHGEKEEEDFEDGCTTSIMKVKWRKKLAAKKYAKEQ